jgi:hypothetical protein
VDIGLPLCSAERLHRVNPSGRCRNGRRLPSRYRALANLRDAELHALIAATYQVPRAAPGLLAWIEGAAEWPLTNADRERPQPNGARQNIASTSPRSRSVSLNAKIAKSSRMCASDRVPVNGTTSVCVRYRNRICAGVRS